jgi:hypothetical protein
MTESNSHLAAPGGLAVQGQEQFASGYTAIDYSGSLSVPVDKLHTATLQHAYCPLVLSYHEQDWTPPGPPRQWTLSFQQRPTASLTLKGDVPTPEEIVKTLASMPWLPLIMVEVIESVVGHLVASRATGN